MVDFRDAKITINHHLSPKAHLVMFRKYQDVTAQGTSRGSEPGPPPLARPAEYVPPSAAPAPHSAPGAHSAGATSQDAQQAQRKGRPREPSWEGTTRWGKELHDWNLSWELTNKSQIDWDWLGCNLNNCILEIINVRPRDHFEAMHGRWQKWSWFSHIYPACCMNYKQWSHHVCHDFPMHFLDS